MSNIQSLEELANVMDIELDDEVPFAVLRRAIARGRVSLQEDGKLRVSMKAPVAVSHGTGEAPELDFRRSTGAERRIMQNAAANQRGDALHKCVSRTCGIRQAQLDTLESSEVALLEEAFTFLS